MPGESCFFLFSYSRSSLLRPLLWRPQPQHPVAHPPFIARIHKRIITRGKIHQKEPRVNSALYIVISSVFLCFCRRGYEQKDARRARGGSCGLASSSSCLWGSNRVNGPVVKQQSWVGGSVRHVIRWAMARQEVFYEDQDRCLHRRSYDADPQWQKRETCRGSPPHDIAPLKEVGRRPKEAAEGWLRRGTNLFGRPWTSTPLWLQQSAGDLCEF